MHNDQDGMCDDQDGVCNDQDGVCNDQDGVCAMTRRPVPRVVATPPLPSLLPI